MTSSPSGGVRGKSKKAMSKKEAFTDLKTSHTHPYTHTHTHIYIYHHHHHIALVARESLTLSRHSYLSFITLGRSSGQHPVSSHSC